MRPARLTRLREPTRPRERVTGVYTKVGRALVAVAAVGALVSGCGSPVQAGSAVIVGDTTVPLEQVQSQVGTLLARVPADQRQQDTAPTLARDIVTNELLHNLLARAAAEQGVTVTDAEVERVHRAAGRRADPPAELRAGPRRAARAGARLPRGHRARPPRGAGTGRHRRPGRVAQPGRRRGQGAHARRGRARRRRALQRQPRGPSWRGGRGRHRHAERGQRGVRHPGRRRRRLPARPAAGHLERLPGHRPAHRRPPGAGRRPRCRCSSSTSSGSARCSRSPTTCRCGSTPATASGTRSSLRVVPADQTAGLVLTPGR